MRAMFRSLSDHPIRLAVLAAVLIGFVSVLFQMSAVYRGAWEDAKGETDAAAEVMRDPAQRAIYELNLEMGNNIVQSLVKTGLARNALILDETGKPFAEANLATLSETSLHTRMGDVLFGGVPAAFVPLHEPNGRRQLGELRIEPNYRLHFARFWSDLLQFALIEFLRVFILAFTLVYLFQYFVIRPFQRLGQAIHQADPANPQQTLQLLRDSRVSSEVGQLGRIIERFLLQAQDRVLQHNRALVRVDELESLQHSLAESERRYRSLIAALSEGVVLQQADGKIVTFNQAALDILGLSDQQIQGRTSFDPGWRTVRENGQPFPPEDHPAMTTLRTGLPLRDVRMGVHRGDGSLVWISINSQPLFGDQAPRPEAVVTSFSDVTARLQAERSVIAEKEAALRYLNTAGVMMLLIGPDGHVRLANRRAAAILQMQPDELLGSDFTQMLATDEDRHMYVAYREQVFASEPGEPVLHELNLRTAHGEIRQVSWSSVLVPDLVSGQLLMLCSGEDHTDELQLRSSLELRSELLEGLASGMVFEQLAAWLTRAFEIYFPRLRCCLIARDLPQALLGCHHPPLAAFWNDWLADCRAGRCAWPQQDGMLPADPAQAGWQLLCQNHAAAAPGQVWARCLSVGGKPPSAYWMIHFDPQSAPSEADQANIDVFLHVAVLGLERAEHEALILRGKDDALAASRAKSDFLANMSHEIRTPLNAVIGFSSLLQQTGLDAVQRDYVASVLTSGEALLGLINDLLDYSKIEAGHLELEPLDFDLRELLDEVLDVFAEKADSKGLYLSQEVAPQIPLRVRADPGRLRQVLINLVGNAIKFTGQGGIRIRLALLEQDSNKLRLRCEVCDSGIGLDEQARSKLFQPFTQADASTTRRFGGTGLGLSICRRLVEAMDGRIGVDSVPGQGATFWFEVAMAQPAAGFCPPSLPASLHGLKFLAVSDCPPVLDCLRAMLGDQVQLLTPQQAAGSDAAGSGYAAILLDVRDANVRAALLQQLPPATRSLCWMSYAEQRGDSMLADAQHRQLLRPIRRRVLLDTLLALLGGQAQPAGQGSSVTLAGQLGGAVPHVLLAEDNPLNQRVAKLMLTQIGCEVGVAENGEQALALLQQQHFDLVLMDCQMPLMDGFQATRAIRALPPQYATVPVIALTANAFQEDRDACLAAGMDDFASKPVTFEALSQIVLRWFKPAPSLAAPAFAVAPPVAGSVAELPAVAQALAELEAQLGREVLPDVIALALGMTRELQPQLLPLLQQQDGDGLARAAHKLKGTVAQIGADDAARALKTLELSARNNDWPAAQSALQQAEQALLQLCAYLDSL
jgi:PAS domain S-box-containing protein